MNEATIVVVEDEEDILDLLEYTLSKEGYDVIACKDTKNFRSILDEEDVNLVLMDRNLPGIEGSEFVAKLRKAGYDFPVIYVSAKDSNEEILQGFVSGGDDYITKPFDLNILKARIKAVLKRSVNIIEVKKEGDILYDSAKKSFSIAGEKINLTKLEHDLLLMFFKNKSVLLSREEILEEVWEDYENKQPKTVNVAIKRLKEKIDPNGEKNYIISVRGEGYMFEVKK